MALRASGLGYLSSGHWLLREIDLDFCLGQLHVLLGANGAGKSSLLRALAGDITPSEGDVLFNDQYLSRYSLEERARLMAVLPQQSTLDFPFLVREVIRMGRYGLTESLSRTQRVEEEVIAALELNLLANQSYTMISGGEQQRVQIARVIAQLWESPGTATYLLDEPDSPLDLAHQVSLFKLCRRLTNDGAAVVLSTHDLNLAARFADRVTLLKSGKVLATGSALEVLTAENIQAAYGVAVAARLGADGWLRIDYPVD